MHLDIHLFYNILGFRLDRKHGIDCLMSLRSYLVGVLLGFKLLPHLSSNTRYQRILNLPQGIRHFK